MKQNTITTTTINATIDEQISPLATIERSFQIGEAGRVTLINTNITPQDFAAYIVSRKEAGDTAYSQARWAYYEAATKLTKELADGIGKRLAASLSDSAFNQLRSEAMSICPLVIKHGFKAPLSTLKDALAAFPEDDKKQKYLPPAKQRKGALKELLPLLESGTVKQAQVRAIRAKYPKEQGGTKKPADAPTGPKAKGNSARLTDQEKVMGGAIAALQNIDKALDEHRVEGDDKQHLLNILSSIARKLGVSLVVPGAPTPAKPAPQTARSQKESA